ncbi:MULTISPECIES: cytochrome P450 [unclassified Nocardia]|uniref:cytochrome P450 n=1 Tax=unclassified Nocardia TaxID=2637762 RepID=UPI001CE45D7D|nr:MULTISPECIES: cytochrome P450 [unclassified Nocardia]
MTESSTDAIELPVSRRTDRPFDPPEGLAEIRERATLTRMRFPDGHLGWLATGHEVVRAVEVDARFSARYELLHDPLHDVDLSQAPAPPGDFGGMDAPEHTRLRRMLAMKFTVRRMRLLTDRIEQISTEYLDAMEKHGPPIDLVSAFAQPVPALTICELLGVPVADQDFFQEQVSAVVEPESFEAMGAAWNQLAAYIEALVAAKRAAPTDDVLSELAAQDLTDAELGGIGTFLLGAGLDTTRSMIALSTFALLENPDQLALLRAEPDIADAAVEELLRYLTIVHTSVRAALVDVELHGQLIKAGESVALSYNAANRDPNRFPDPDTLDLRRRPVGHLAFGHGPHQCLGQQLARVEMRVALPALVSRFPTLALACSPAEVPVREGNIFGLRRLPVTW